MSTNDIVIYCNGDSFANGWELGDYILDGYPGAYSNSDFHKCQQRYNDWYTLSMDQSHPIGKQRIENQKKLFELQAQRVFANKIEQKTGYKVINSALNKLGASQNSITRTTITDLYKLKQQYKKIIAIISNTSINRQSVPVPSNNWTDIMLPCNITKPNNHWETKLAGYADFIHYYYQDYHMLYDWLKDVFVIKSFCEFHKIPILWTTGMTSAQFNEHLDAQDLKAFRDAIDLKYDVNLHYLAIEIDKDVWLPGYHFSEVVHEKTAEILVEKINSILPNI